MRRQGQLAPRVLDTANLWRAWCEFRRGKGSRPSVRSFAFDTARRLARLRRELVEGTYRPGAYRLFLVHEPKRRLISAATVRDRVVHHALHRVLAPVLDRGLVPHCYACLPGRGVQRAALAFQRAMRRFDYVLLLDVRCYFPSIDPAIVLAILERRIKDAVVLDLCRKILDSGRGLYDSAPVRGCLGLTADWPPRGRGLPIGNLTSQWWGNHYLSKLDHGLRRELHLPHAQRYMDDLGLFANSRAQLQEARGWTAEWLLRERHQRLKRASAPRSTRRPVVYLGRRIARSSIEPTSRALQRMTLRVGDALRSPDGERIERTLASYRGSLGLGRWGPEVSL